MEIDPESSNSSRRDVRTSRLQGIGARLPEIVFCAGFFCLFTGMIWVGDRGLFSRLFYWLIALPSLLMLAFSPKDFAGLLKSRIFLAYLPFAAYMAIASLWSESADGVWNLAKRPLFVALLFLAVFGFGHRRHGLLLKTLKWSALFSVFAAFYVFYLYFSGSGHGRLGGPGALSNPLLVSHFFGFFLALWLGHYFCKRKLVEPLFFIAFATLIGLLFATGSRTPLVATMLTAAWLAVLTRNLKGVAIIAVLLVLGSAALYFFPETITQRGFSYRPEIWTKAIGQILEEPWFGHGFGAPLRIRVNVLNKTFSEPHNLTLAVFYAGGIVGGILWIAVYFTALREAWRWRRDPWVIVFSAVVVYGLAAGLTEGGAFFPRPREHWYLVWIPMALLAHAVYRAKKKNEPEESENSAALRGEEKESSVPRRP
jgi:O-antigen ligase